MNESMQVFLGLTSLVLVVVVYVWTALALGALFRKAGEESWKGWVPLLNAATVLQLGGFSPWLVLLGFLPVANVVYFVFHIIAMYRISRSFGYGAGMTVLGALLFVVWASVLGFGSARWLGAAPTTAGPMRTGGTPPAPSPYPNASAPHGAAYTPLVGPAAPAPAAAASAPAGAVPGPAAPAPSAAPPPPAPAAPAPPAPPTSAPTSAIPAWGPPPPAPAASSHAAAPETAPVSFPPLPPPPPTHRVDVSSALDDDLEDSAVDPEDRLPAPARRVGSFTPPPVPDAEPPAPATPSVPIASVPGVRAGAAAPASAPAASVPAASAPVTDVPAPAPAAPAPEPWAPAEARPADEGFPEPSEAVSAVAGSPDAGAPRSARSSVSALYAQPEIPADAEDDDDDDDGLDGLDQTVIAKRRRIPWALVPPGGTPIDISADVVILGRRPAADPAYPGAQLVSITDETRTVSKTHARLELRGETWYVTDLGSTNGVLFATLMGTEVEAQPGQEIEAGERFFLGDAEVRLARSEG